MKKTLNDFPDYVLQKEKLDNLKFELSGLIEDRASLQANLLDARGNDFDKQAERLLEVGWESADIEATEKKLSTVEDKINVLSRAIVKQNDNLTQIVREASIAICADLKPAYHLLIKKYAEALKALREAELALITFKDDLTSQGIIDKLGPLPLVGKPIAQCWDSMKGHLARFCEEAGCKVEML